MSGSRYIMVGDPHGEAGDLDDLNSLLTFVGQLSDRHKAPILFLGDQYDTHAIVHLEVMLAWHDFLVGRPDTIMLRGNHDAPANSDTRATALLAHASQCRIVTYPSVIENVLFVPYTKDKDEFRSWCWQHGNVHTAICHQAFEGSQFETGYFAKDEVKPEELPQEMIISGHVHAASEFGKVWHPGAPRWRIVVDAKMEERFVWLVEFDDKGRLVNRTPFETSPHVRRICCLVDSPESPLELDGASWPAKDDVRVDVRGPKERVDERAPLFEAAGAKVRKLPDAERRSDVRESDGVQVAWGKWLRGYKAQHGTSPEVLQKMVRERVGEAAAA